MAQFELYRKSTLGLTLTDALDEMVSAGVLPPQLAVKFLLQFDKSMNNALATQVKQKVNFKGHLHTYRFCDNVWTFILENAVFKTDSGSIVADKVKQDYQPISLWRTYIMDPVVVELDNGDGRLEAHMLSQRVYGNGRVAIVLIGENAQFVLSEKLSAEQLGENEFFFKASPWNRGHVTSAPNEGLFEQLVQKEMVQVLRTAIVNNVTYPVCTLTSRPVDEACNGAEQQLTGQSTAFPVEAGQSGQSVLAELEPNVLLHSNGELKGDDIAGCRLSVDRHVEADLSGPSLPGASVPDTVGGEGSVIRDTKRTASTNSANGGNQQNWNWSAGIEHRLQERAAEGADDHHQSWRRPSLSDLQKEPSVSVDSDNVDSFNIQSGGQPLSSSQRGFKLLEKMGWRKGVGLGIREDGQQEPITIAVKRDRAGLQSSWRDVADGSQLFKEDNLQLRIWRLSKSRQLLNDSTEAEASEDAWGTPNQQESNGSAPAAHAVLLAKTDNEVPDTWDAFSDSQESVTDESAPDMALAEPSGAHLAASIVQSSPQVEESSDNVYDLSMVLAQLRGMEDNFSVILDNALRGAMDASAPIGARVHSGRQWVERLQKALELLQL
eukprot:jgi/Chlat1/1549/Chrsp122S01822